MHELKLADNESIFIVEDPKEVYGLHDLLFKSEVYEFIGCCMEVHKTLGKGFLEAVYKDALCYELGRKNIPFEKEKKY